MTPTPAPQQVASDVAGGASSQGQLVIPVHLEHGSVTSAGAAFPVARMQSSPDGARVQTQSDDPFSASYAASQSSNGNIFRQASHDKTSTCRHPSDRPAHDASQIGIFAQRPPSTHDLPDGTCVVQMVVGRRTLLESTTRPEADLSAREPRTAAIVPPSCPSRDLSTRPQKRHSEPGRATSRPAVGFNLNACPEPSGSRAARTMRRGLQHSKSVPSLTSSRDIFALTPVKEESRTPDLDASPQETAAGEIDEGASEARPPAGTKTRARPSLRQARGNHTPGRRGEKRQRPAMDNPQHSRQRQGVRRQVVRLSEEEVFGDTHNIKAEDIPPSVWLDESQRSDGADDVDMDRSNEFALEDASSLNETAAEQRACSRHSLQVTMPNAAMSSSCGAPSNAVEARNRATIKKLVHHQLLGRGIEKRDEDYVACFGATCTGTAVALVSA